MAYGDPGAFLYHYTTLARAVEAIIPSQQLLLNPFSRMNDPREARDWGVSASGWGEDPFPGSEFWNAYRVTNRLKETCKLICLSEDAMGESHTGEFARGYARPRMWAHYGDNHRGVCLIFDRDQLHEHLLPTLTELGEVFSDSVAYRDAPIPTRALTLSINAILDQGIERVLDALVASYWRELFFTKACDWATEREFRYLVRTHTEGPAFVSIEGAMRAVCIGDAVSDVYEPSLHALCAENGLDLCKINWHNGKPIIVRRTPPGAPDAEERFE
jgi:hypothetical protein